MSWMKSISMKKAMTFSKFLNLVKSWIHDMYQMTNKVTVKVNLKMNQTIVGQNSPKSPMTLTTYKFNIYP